MRLIVISNETEIANEMQLVNQLFEKGLEYFHLRKPAFGRPQMEKYIEKVNSEYHKKIVVHSHHDLCETYGLKGIHYNSRWTMNNENEYSAYQKSSSFHSITEIENCNKNLEYVFLSPVFKSISKKDYESKFDFIVLQNELKRLKKLILPQVIALGGIDEDKIKIAAGLGFDGIAILGAIWQSSEPVQKFKSIKSICNNV